MSDRVRSQQPQQSQPQSQLQQQPQSQQKLKRRRKDLNTFNVYTNKQGEITRINEQLTKIANSYPLSKSFKDAEQKTRRARMDLKQYKSMSDLDKKDLTQKEYELVREILQEYVDLYLAPYDKYDEETKTKLRLGFDEAIRTYTIWAYITQLQAAEKKKRHWGGQQEKQAASPKIAKLYLFERTDCGDLYGIPADLYRPLLFKIYFDIDRIAHDLAQTLFSSESKFIQFRLNTPGILRTLRQALGVRKDVKETQLQRDWSKAIVSQKLEESIAFQLKFVLKTKSGDDDIIMMMTRRIYTVFRDWLQEYNLLFLDAASPSSYKCNDSSSTKPFTAIQTIQTQTELVSYILTLICTELLVKQEQINKLQKDLEKFSEDYEPMFKKCQKIVETLHPFLDKDTRNLLTKHMVPLPKHKRILLKNPSSSSSRPRPSQLSQRSITVTQVQKQANQKILAKKNHDSTCILHVKHKKWLSKSNSLFNSRIQTLCQVLTDYLWGDLVDGDTLINTDDQLFEFLIRSKLWNDPMTDDDKQLLKIYFDNVSTGKNKRLVFGENKTTTFNKHSTLQQFGNSVVR